MATTYTAQELSDIAEAPVTAGMVVSIADMGIVSTAIEMAALSKVLANSAEKYPSNSIIQAVFSPEAIKSGGFKIDKPDIKPEDVQAGTAVDKAIAAINTTLALLNTKATPQEVQEYKAFIYDAAEAVAEAAGSGLFGSGNPKVSEAEASALARLKAALAI